MRITNKKNFINHTYYIENTPINEVTCTKYLGVSIDHKMSWNEHIQRITSKADQVNAFLHCNLRHCPSSIKCNCYKSMVRPIVEYASNVWDPHTISNINRVESVQRAAARICFNDFSTYLSVTTMLTSLDLPTLKSRRTRAKLIMMYKIINGIMYIPTNYFTPCHPQSRRNYKQLVIRVDSYKFSFIPSVIKLWNSLPLL